jgi:hypothetical protein
MPAQQQAVNVVRKPFEHSSEKNKMKIAILLVFPLSILISCNSNEK